MLEVGPTAPLKALEGREIHRILEAIRKSAAKRNTQVVKDVGSSTVKRPMSASRKATGAQVVCHVAGHVLRGEIPERKLEGDQTGLASLPR